MILVAPVPKACQLVVEKALQTPYSPDRFVPRCKKDGSYEEVQCSEQKGECWCVNSRGVEERGTRSQDFVTCPAMGKYDSEIERHYTQLMDNFACPPYQFKQVLNEHDANKNIYKAALSHSVLQRDPMKIHNVKEQPASV